MSTITLAIETKGESIRIERTIDAEDLGNALKEIPVLERAIQTAWGESVVLPGMNLTWRRNR